MKTNSKLKPALKKTFFFILLLPLFFSCENHRFDSDKRQIMAKDAIQDQLSKACSFNVTAFKEDTLKSENDPNFKNEIRYSLDIEFIDSNKVFQKKKGIVFFTPDGKSIINSKITDR